MTPQKDKDMNANRVQEMRKYYIACLRWFTWFHSLELRYVVLWLCFNKIQNEFHLQSKMVECHVLRQCVQTILIYRSVNTLL